MRDRPTATESSQLKPPLDWHCMTGVGCYGKPAALIRRLRSILIKIEQKASGSCAPQAWPSGMARLVRQLILFLSDGDLASDLSLLSTGACPRQVAGFFISLHHGQGRVCVFMRNKGASPT